MKNYFVCILICLVINGCSNSTDNQLDDLSELSKMDTEKNGATENSDFDIYFNQFKSHLLTTGKFGGSKIDSLSEVVNYGFTIYTDNNWFGISVDSVYLKGGLTEDDKDEIILHSTNIAGNISWEEYYVIEGDGFINNISFLSEYSDKPVGDYFLQLEKIEDGYIVGDVIEVEETGISKYDINYKNIPGKFYYEKGTNGLLFYSDEE